MPRRKRSSGSLARAIERREVVQRQVARLTVDIGMHVVVGRLTASRRRLRDSDFASELEKAGLATIAPLQVAT